MEIRKRQEFIVSANLCFVDLASRYNLCFVDLASRYNLCFVDLASRYNRVKKNQLDAQLVLSIFR